MLSTYYIFVGKCHFFLVIKKEISVESIAGNVAWGVAENSSGRQ
jgi:hypothetical protein